MILILDDTFIDRHKYTNVAFLEESSYKNICKVLSVVKPAQLEEMANEIPSCELFCNHKTLQLFDNAGEPLSLESNTKRKEGLVNLSLANGIPRLEFSKGLDTDLSNLKIDKDLFYENLKDFLDHYITENAIEIKIFFYGKKYQEHERITAIQKALSEIRVIDIENYEKNAIIFNGISVLYGEKETFRILKEWQINQTSKNEIVNQINLKLYNNG
jgi:hypothetical protein